MKRLKYAKRPLATPSCKERKREKERREKKDERKEGRKKKRKINKGKKRARIMVLGSVVSVIVRIGRRCLARNDVRGERATKFVGTNSIVEVRSNPLTVEASRRGENRGTTRVTTTKGGVGASNDITTWKNNTLTPERVGTRNPRDIERLPIFREMITEELGISIPGVECD